MPDWLAVGIGGFAGAVSRFQISLWLSGWSTQRFGRVYPFGTFAVNIAGCLLIGILMTLAADKKIPDAWQRALVTGCLGSLTTFSTFSYETIELIRDDRPVSRQPTSSRTWSSVWQPSPSGWALPEPSFAEKSADLLITEQKFRAATKLDHQNQMESPR